MFTSSKETAPKENEKPKKSQFASAGFGSSWKKKKDTKISIALSTAKLDVSVGKFRQKFLKNPYRKISPMIKKKNFRISLKNRRLIHRRSPKKPVLGGKRRTKSQSQRDEREPKIENANQKMGLY